MKLLRCLFHGCGGPIVACIMRSEAVTWTFFKTQIGPNRSECFICSHASVISRQSICQKSGLLYRWFSSIQLFSTGLFIRFVQDMWTDIFYEQPYKDNFCHGTQMHTHHISHCYMQEQIDFPECISPLSLSYYHWILLL